MKANIPTPISVTTEGNTVITRYAPPPGYQAPSRPQSPWTWATPNYGQPAAGYQQSSYMPQATLPQQQYTSAGFPKIQASLSAAQQHDWASPYDNSRSAPPVSGSWQQQHHAQGSYSQRHNSLPHIATFGPLLDGNGDILPPEDMTVNTSESLEHDFDSECYYARHPDEIEPELSLGLIEWKAPMPAKRALPATFNEAELEALAPRIDPLPGDCTSDYFSFANRAKSLLGVRDTDVWQEVKDQVIYRKLAAACRDLVSINGMKACYRVQYDKQWEEASRPPTPALTREPTPARTDSRPVSRASNYSQAMEVDDHFPTLPTERYKSITPSIEPGVMDDLEAALRTDSRFTTHSQMGSVAHSRAGSVTHSRGGSVSHSRAGSVSHSRAGSVSHTRAGSVSHQHSRSGSVHSHHRRQSSTKISHSKPLPPIHDSKQEDILAALGVTGAPQLVYQTPGPAFGPRPSTAGSDRPSSRNNSVTSLHDPPGPIMPPTIKEEDPEPTIKEDDPEPDDDATPRPVRYIQANNMRKRSYADSVAGAQQYLDDQDATPKRLKSGSFRV